LPISIEDVIYRAQAEEEQERQPTTIAGSGQSPTTTNASSMAPAQVSQTTVPTIQRSGNNLVSMSRRYQIRRIRRDQ
jgi:hypothetical protein